MEANAYRSVTLSLLVIWGVMLTSWIGGGTLAFIRIFSDSPPFWTRPIIYTTAQAFSFGTLFALIEALGAYREFPFLRHFKKVFLAVGTVLVCMLAVVDGWISLFLPALLYQIGRRGTFLFLEEEKETLP